MIRKELGALVDAPPVLSLSTRVMSLSTYDLEKVYWIAGILFFVVLILKALRS